MRKHNLNGRLREIFNGAQAWAVFYLPRSDEFIFFYNPSFADLYFQDFVLDTLTLKKKKFSIQKWINSNKAPIHLAQYFGHKVVVAFYEFHHICLGLKTRHMRGDTPLLLDCHFQNSLKIKRKALCTYQLKKDGLSFSAMGNPDFQKYQEKFYIIQKHLRNGDCYQVNLTEQFQFDVKGSHLFFNSLQSKTTPSAFSHSIILPSLQREYVSHSPECLASLRWNHLGEFTAKAYPIKGTLESYHNPHVLLSSKKDESELFMITDLMRNDLNALGSFRAKVLIKKKLMKVPGLWHQYSLIENQLCSPCSLSKVFTALFPAGSITGAPKKRVCQIIAGLESEPRGFYCGSTLLFSRAGVDISVNIRSGEFDRNLGIFSYGAGGGITLQSQVEDEYQEMLAKVRSFTAAYTSYN